MRNAPMTAALALVVPVVLAFGCGNEDSGVSSSARDSVAVPWRQTDLWSLAGASERTQYGTPEHRMVRALTQAPGQSLRFPLELGESAQFSFRPLVAPDHACTFSVWLNVFGDSALSNGPRVASVAETSERVYSQAQLPTGPTLSPVVSVDLSALAYQQIELVLETANVGETACRPYWGSPTVVDRQGGALPRGLERAAPNVLLLTADTLRADALGVWGREPSGSPALDHFAASSDVWLDAFSSINNTNPSFASLMTGLYVKNHRVFNLTTPLPEQHTTLAEVLSDAGYATRAIIAAAHLGRAGLRQGFDEFTQPGGQFFAETVVDMGIDWLQEGGEQPFFLWLHFFDAHTPHHPPEPFAQGLGPSELSGMRPVTSWAPFREGGKPVRGSARRDPSAGNPLLYASEVAYLDRQLDRLFDFLASHGLTENTIIVFVADHGETLGERWTFYNHVGLYEETTHVPLMIHWPGQREGRRIEGLVQHFDVLPTLLASLGLPIPDQDGIDLRSGAPGAAPREIVFANHADNLGEMARTKEHLYLVHRNVANLPNGPHFYSLAEDPRATRDLLGQGRPAEALLRGRLLEWMLDRRQVAEPKRRVVGAEERKQLEALGYVD